ncbi:putative FMN-dependent luciferase-like monooxygenase [Nonomuraea zeae]|uniref:Putative FMN-dependent luciferase-like monooxygenase n=1 Tax=Nonomuraea zeae TaxID=1642303 RepID=A0A5S4GU12_9ACTN|nr:putative FMN-dependent luciferase-like monooxygenase [Nonomuraea zeae]TMR36212.1 putative FMN-dependent luciferase-like monooxygenase [Nonomuraea zeae]
MRIGFFTRLLDDVAPAERYRLATEQIAHAESLGFDTAWVAQHHFDGAEGGLPAPLVFLAHVAARTSRIRLGTGIITLPLEQPVRVAEDTAVLDLLTGGRLEVGVGSGGTPASFAPFGHDSAERSAIYAEHLATLVNAWSGGELGGGNRLYPPAPRLLEAVWEATFSVSGGTRAGKAGNGLMLSRTQPRPADDPQATLAQIQRPIVDAYYENLPPGTTPRIMASRTAFVADSRAEALRYAELGLGRGRLPFELPDSDLDRRIAAFDVHVGTPQDVIESLRADPTLSRVTDLVFQAHSVDPPHPLILRSIELLATEVAPALGWVPSTELSST